MTLPHDTPLGGESGAVFVNQMSRAGQIGPMASWITIAGWAGAAERTYGRAWMVTTDGVLAPSEALMRASQPVRRAEAVPSWRRRIPEPVVTGLKDVRRIGENRRFRSHADPAPWRDASVSFVMGLHGLFWDAALQWAGVQSVPSVLVVDACQVREARSWGVTRPGWSHLAERLGERPQLRNADVVVCVSSEVAEQVSAVAQRRQHVVVIPNGVDTELFSPADAGTALRSELGLDGRFVVGWSGSFRTFHGLETLVDAAAKARLEIPELSLLLVGDGMGRPEIERRAADLGVPLVAPGTVPFHRVPDYLRCMDVAVALAPAGSSFHYSPVKLREYQACGVPVVVAAAGEMARAMHDGDDALFVTPGDVSELATALSDTASDPGAAIARANRGREHVVREGSWDRRLAALELALESTR